MKPSSTRNSWNTSTSRSKTAPVSGRPIVWRSALRQHVRGRPQVGHIGHRERMAGDAELLGVRQLADAVQLVRQVDVAARGAQQVVDDRVEVQHRDHRRAVGGGLVEGEVLGADPVRRRHAEKRVDEGVPELVGEHVEVETEGMGPRAPEPGETGLDEAVAALGVVPVDDGDELEPVEILPRSARESRRRDSAPRRRARSGSCRTCAPP